MKKLFFLAIVLAFISCNSGTKKTNTEKKETEPVEIVEATINIGGMTCEMCVASIKKGVNELEGIKSLAVSLNDSTAIVKFDVAKMDLTRIEKAIEKRGYSIKKDGSN